MAQPFAIEGLAELFAKLDDVAAVATPKILASAVRQAVRPIVAEAKRLAPKDTHELADSIGATVIRPKGGTQTVAGGIKVGRRKIENEITGDTVVRDASYRWHFAEFGVASRGIPAHPYLRPAFDAKYREAIDVFKVAMSDSIRRAVRKSTRAAAAQSATAGADLGALAGGT